MKCIAIDDEPLALEILKEFCRRTGGMQIDTYTNPESGLAAVKRERPEIVFLDIEMGGVSGLEMAREIPQGCFLIFTTAYAQYALDGFDLNAVDFLHKPFSFARFEKAVRKAVELRQLMTISSATVFSGQSVTVKSDYRNVSILLNDIVYIESLGNYIIIRLSDGSSVSSLMSMKDIMSILPEDQFIRIHKSYIVPLPRISSWTSREVCLAGGKRLPVGRAYSEILKSSITLRQQHT